MQRKKDDTGAGNANEIVGNMDNPSFFENNFGDRKPFPGNFQF